MNNLKIFENGEEKEINLFKLVSNNNEDTIGIKPIKSCLFEYGKYSILNKRSSNSKYKLMMNSAFADLVVSCYNKYKLQAIVNSEVSDNILVDESLFNEFVEVVFVSLVTVKNVLDFEEYFIANLKEHFSKNLKLSQFAIKEN